MKTTCNYCRASNAEDDHRCNRCGRRLQSSPPQTLAAAYGVANTATARNLRPVPQPTPVAPIETQPAPETTARRPAYQRSLFSPRELPRVVAFESIAPKPPERNRTGTEPSKPRTRRPVPGQQTIEFTAPVEDVDESGAFIYCDAPVAVQAHRVMATAADWSLIAIALALFAGVFHLFGGQVLLTKQTMPIFIAMAVVLGLFYRALWCLADEDSPGMRWAHLRVVDFDGRKPGRRQRFFRIAAACLSYMAAGLGILWAMGDEEALTWHDHISKTFPTPY